MYNVTVDLFLSFFLYWHFSYGKIGLFSSWKASCDRVALPNLRCMMGVSTIHRTLTSTTGSLTCAQLFLHAVAHGGWGEGRGATDTVLESALKVEWKKNPLPHQVIEPTSAACRSDALTSYIPTRLAIKTPCPAAL